MYEHYRDPYTYNVHRETMNPYGSGRMAMSGAGTGMYDYGPQPFVIDIDEAATRNDDFRTALWTGRYLQLTLMSIQPGEDIGLEIHPETDQFVRIEEGRGLVMMGDSADFLGYRQPVKKDVAFIIPAGKWHNLINTGDTPLKLYSIYAPPQHLRGTVHRTKAEAEAAERQTGH
jgi:mannose-6-phosphate isomerase-like protein (cupin superfamily)